MAPGAKRKRGNYTQDDQASPRPSPYRPENGGLAHPQQSGPAQQTNSPRGGRHSRGGGRGAPQTPRSSNVAQPSPTAVSTPMSNAPPTKPSLNTPSVPTPMDEQSSSPEVPEFNDYLTQERVSNWNAAARDAVVQAAVVAQRDGDIMTLTTVYEEIIEASIAKVLSPEVLGSMVQEITTAPSDDTVDSVASFLDMLSICTKTAHEELKRMLQLSGIKTLRMCTLLEADLLISLGLVRPSFPRVAIRKATLSLYRQSNYNLLREESEGYAKLLTECFMTPTDVTLPKNQKVVEETYKRISAYIGAFDLDVGRVLDITLDVFANLLVKSHRYFIKLLVTSPWWPELQHVGGIEWDEPEVSTLPAWALPSSSSFYDSDEEKQKQLQLRQQRDRKFWDGISEKSGILPYFELGARRITSDLSELGRSAASGTLPDADESPKKKSQKWLEEWMTQTGTLLPPGNEIAAQLLGFKLQLYASGDPQQLPLPENLIYLAALLIKVGFISLADLYPHLYPLDDDMPAHKDKLMKAKMEKEEKLQAKGKNALAMAGALPDEPHGASRVSQLQENKHKASSKSDSERSTPTKIDEENKQKAEPVDQKAALLRSLLAIGAIPDALFILGRFSWLVDVYPDLHTHILRIVHYSLDKVYASARPTSLEQFQRSAKGLGSLTLSRETDFVPRRTLRWAKIDEKDSGDADYRFYYEEWVDNVPVCQNTEDVMKLCNTFLPLVGVEIGKDALLLTKLARIGRKSLDEDSSTANFQRWIVLCRTLLAPALTFTGRNPGVVNEVWELLKCFDTKTRFSIYQNWFAPLKKADVKPPVRAIFRQAEKDTKDLCRRITAKNTKSMGKAIAKLACACPGVVLRLALAQGQSYGNMVDALVECSHYLTPLGYDCLNWSIVHFLQTDRNNMQGDGMFTKASLKNTAIFAGKVYLRYDQMDPTPTLELLASRLQKQKDYLPILSVLEQMIVSMTGIAVSGPLTESRVLALAAGPRLRSFTLEHILGDHRDQSSESAKRFLKPIKDNGLAARILILLTRECDALPYIPEFEDAPTKVLATNLDNVRSHFVHYLDFLRTYLSVKEIDTMLPGVAELICVCEAPYAFAISRAAISEKADADRLERWVDSTNSKQEQDANGDVMMGIVENATTELVQAERNPTKDVEMEDVTEKLSMPNQTSTSLSLATPGCTNRAIEAVAEQLRAAHPAQFGKHPCLGFYVTFWQLTLGNIYIPSREDSEKNLLKEQYEQASKHYETKASSLPNDRRAQPKVLAEKQHLRGVAAKLKTEFRESSDAALLLGKQLQVEMLRWFDDVPMTDSRSDDLHWNILQECFLPRIRMSTEDAQFASSMLMFMHKSGVPGFRTMKLLDMILGKSRASDTSVSLPPLIMSFTEEESKNFGRFLHGILKELHSWHENKDDTYTEQAHGHDKRLPGFARKFNSDRSPEVLLSYKDFRHLLYKWHNALNGGLKTCLESGDYLQTRNAINILKALFPYFPRIDAMGNDLRRVVKDLAQSNTTDDVKVAANSLLFEFQKNQKLWIPDGVFRGTESVHGDNTRTTSTQNQTPNPTEASSGRLSATANSFNPRVADLNGATSHSAKGSNGIVDRVMKDAPEVSPRDLEYERNRPNAHYMKSSTQAYAKDTTRSTSGPLSQASVPPHASVRPDNRLPHALPTRPDAQPPRPRQPERPGDRQPEYHNRNDYGRAERNGESLREREASPGRRIRNRTPDRGPGAIDRREWSGREYDDRALRPLPRDTRGPPGRGPAWVDGARDARDVRDSRDPRDHRDPRDAPPRAHQLPPSLDARGRIHSNSAAGPEGAGLRRDIPPASHQGADRTGPFPPPPAQNAASSAGATINPDRAALINDDRGGNDIMRSDRDVRHDRGSRPQSPRRSDDRSQGSYHSHGGEVGRNSHDVRTPPQPYTQGRDRREEPTGITPTGPRGGRIDPSTTARVSREMFQPSQSTRPAAQQVQDPNYGRLNPPPEPIPAGPRNPASDRRESQGNTPVAPPPLSAPAVPQSTGIHPSRMNNFQKPPPPLQTDVPGAPSGPRSSARTPQPPIPSPTTRAPPTGPAAAERNGRNQENRNALRTINNVLTQSAPGPQDRSSDRGTPVQNPQIRGRGANRANGLVDTPTMPAPPTTPDFRAEGQNARAARPEHTNHRLETHSQDDGRVDARGHREHRRSDRSGRDRSKSPDRSDKRIDERNVRNGPADRTGRPDESINQERVSTRDRKGTDREGVRRERDKDAERLPRDGRERRDRSTRDDNRASARSEDATPRRGGPPVVEPSVWPGDGRMDPRNGEPRGRGNGDRRDERDRRGGRDDNRDSRDGRKRGRGTDDGRDPADLKRSRRSN
ncbi:transcription factor/nuclear export subunit protein 2-domain-containing protein [Massariosphaeria phaeospora]|uniref:THO complex subunit 2 n=1 Tax=Massariosphaeria phaeospora TaxID=100035 RepID=A0A7C8I199_9PLEO|nr:transcription factor/nuclear export subunit protein 2-domain-containing protein [Massariosphaeria phaeospora]